MEPITDLDVARAQDRAHAADEVADNAGLDLAEAMVTGIGDVDELKATFVRARAAATYAWSVLDDAIDQADRDRHQVPA